MNRALIRAFKRCAGSPVIGSVFRHYSGAATCLMYHSVPGDLETSNHPLRVTAGHFEEQIAYISRHCACLHVLEAVELLEQGRLPKRTVLVTFDDGYRDNYTVALPILDKYRVPATVFVTVGLVDRRTSFWWHEIEFILERLRTLEFEWEDKTFRFNLEGARARRYAFDQLNPILMGISPLRQEALIAALRSRCPETFSYDNEILTWEETRALAASPMITIGSHTLAHPVLSQLPPDELLCELVESKKVLELKLGKEVSVLGYPFGARAQVGARESAAAQGAGYRCAFTTRCGHIFPKHEHHLFALPRIAMDGRDELFHLRWKLCGAESLHQNRGRRFVTI